jgi:hypothetical protein
MPPTFWPSLPDPCGPISPGARALYEELDKTLTGMQFFLGHCAIDHAHAACSAQYREAGQLFPASAAATGERARRYKVQFGFRLLLTHMIAVKLRKPPKPNEQGGACDGHQ